MQKRICLIFLSLLVPCLATCAYTRVTSFKDPERLPGKTYAKIAVFAPLSDLASRSVLERAFVDAFHDKSVSADTSIGLISPTHQPSRQEIEANFRSSGYDALLLIDLTAQKSGTINIYLGWNVVTKPIAKFNIQLIDLASQKTVWVSSSLTEGSAYSGAETMSQSLANKIVTQLKDDGLI